MDALMQALQDVGLAPGDTVFVHACLDALGIAADDEPALYTLLRTIIGESGTILVPTYTFSFCRNQPFDVGNTPTHGGPWSTATAFLEHVRQQPGAVRSRDPIHSVAGVGPAAAALLANVPNTCFGPDSVFARLIAADAKICVIGTDLGEATVRHYVEALVGVPFRFKKLFTGTIIAAERSYTTGWIYDVRILAQNGFPTGARLEALARSRGVCRTANVAGSVVLLVASADYFQLTVEALGHDRWCTAVGPPGDPVALEAQRVGGPTPSVALPPQASMAALIDGLWTLPRDIVSDGYDAALAALATQIPMTIHAYPSGTECWDWIVPEKWTCHEAYLETQTGERLCSYADHPLHVVSYSLPFTGAVSRDELFAHLHTHQRLPDAVPFVFKYYERDWGLCCSQQLKQTLTDDTYRVVIRSDFSYGTLKVGEVVVPGASATCIVLCAHLCHPAMVNDDLTGVVVGLAVMRELQQRSMLRYTYRLLIVPETIGSVAYLSHNPDVIAQTKGGLFLEMLGQQRPHALQHSFAGDSELDHCFALALRDHDPASWTGAFRTLIGNDERQFNAPGVRIPMLSLSRILPATAPDAPYPEYHSSKDTPDAITNQALEESRTLVLAMIDALEQNVVPVNCFKGEPFCSRHGLNIDVYTNPEAHRALFDIIALVDGTRSIAAIATACGVAFATVKQVVDQLVHAGLVEHAHADLD